MLTRSDFSQPAIEEGGIFKASAVDFKEDTLMEEREDTGGALIEPPPEKSRYWPMARLSTGKVITVGFFSVLPNWFWVNLPRCRTRYFGNFCMVYLFFVKLPPVTTSTYLLPSNLARSSEIGSWGITRPPLSSSLKRGLWGMSRVKLRKFVVTSMYKGVEVGG